MINVEVQKSGSENPLATIRKFSRRVQGTGIVKTVRGNRYFSRATSKTVKKKHALKLINRRAEYRKLIKEGKIAEPAPRRGAPQREQTSASTSTKLGEGTPIAR